MSEIRAIERKLASVVFPWWPSVFPRLLLEENETYQRWGKAERNQSVQTHWLQGKETAHSRDGDRACQAEGYVGLG